MAPHEEETFINFVKKFEMKRDGEEGTDDDEDDDEDEEGKEDSEKTPKKGRGGRVIKKRKLEYVIIIILFCSSVFYGIIG